MQYCRRFACWRASERALATAFAAVAHRICLSRLSFSLSSAPFFLLFFFCLHSLLTRRRHTRARAALRPHTCERHAHLVVCAAHSAATASDRRRRRRRHSFAAFSRRRQAHTCRFSLMKKNFHPLFLPYTRKSNAEFWLKAALFSSSLVGGSRSIIFLP